jgi:hypothetical protein
MGIREVVFEVEEIDFPASRDDRTLRGIALYGLRRASQSISRLMGVENHGNRYFYVGEKI